MKLEVCSAARIARRAREPFAPRTTLISIGDPDGPPPVLLHKPAHMLRLEFDDLTEDLARSFLNLPQDLQGKELDEVLARNNTYLFSEVQAREAAKFIKAHINTTDRFLCQCEMGQSRSAAVAAAIAEYFFGRGDLVFSDDCYSPNPLVYARLLSALRPAVRADNA